MSVVELQESGVIEVGDHVFVGEPRNGKVHWIVTSIHQAALGKIYATLQSGMTMRSRVVPIERLVLHTKAKKKGRKK